MSLHECFSILTFVIGIIIGIIVHYTGFCVYGSLAEWMGVRANRRLTGALVAILVFGLVHLWGFKGNISCGGIWKGSAGLHSFLGGFIQGLGYVLITGCPLTLLVRIGQGSKSHVIAVLFFALGVSIFGYLKEPLVDFFSSFMLESKTLLIHTKEKKFSTTIPLQTIDDGKLIYEEKDNLISFKYQPKNRKEQLFRNSPILIYIPPACCPSCHPEAISFIKDLEDKFAKEGLITLGIFRNHSVEGTIEPFIKKYNIPWLIARDPGYTILKEFNVTPETFFFVILIDKGGKIHLKQEGFSKKDKDKYQREIELMLRN